MPDILAPSATVTALPEALRLSVRAERGDVHALSEAFGLAFPERISDVAGTPERFVACLGPDEWLFTAPVSEREAAMAIAYGLSTSIVCSVTDIGARELCFAIEGPGAVSALNSGCPTELEALEMPSASRTVFEGVQITLVKWRADAWRLEIWRSFATHVLACLDLAQRDVNFDI